MTDQSGFLQIGGVVSDLDQIEADNIILKIKKAIRVLVEKNITESDGVYYEISDDDQIKEIGCGRRDITNISNTITPYVVFATNERLSMFYGSDLDVFKFFKKEYETGGFILEFQINQKTSENILTILLFLISVFNDYFKSNKINQLNISELSSLIEGS